MPKKHLTFDCPVCHEPDEVVAHVQAAVVGAETGRWICFHCRAEGSWTISLTADEKADA